jgi:hypothetical protein
LEEKRLDKKSIYLTIETIFNKFQLNKIEDSSLKYCDFYYTDITEKKYIFVCKHFEDKTELISRWEEYQDKDIALYLQREKYAKRDIRWDIYFLLFYSGKEKITEEEYHKIEKDRFCCKKFIIDSEGKERIEEDFNRKLPFTSNYYGLDKIADTITDNEFYNLLRDEAKLSKETISDSMLSNILENKKEIIKCLFQEERLK